MTEIQQIEKALSSCRWSHPESEEYKSAKAYLERVHKKYGTVDVRLIQELIN